MNGPLDMGGYGVYVWSSYAAFALFLMWDLVAARIRLARARREIRARIRREQARSKA